MENHESDIEGSISGPEHDIMSEEEDDDSRISNNSRTEAKPQILDPDVLARLKQIHELQHGGLPFGQEDLERSLPFFFPTPHMMASHFAAAAAADMAKKDKDNLIQRDRSPIRSYGEEGIGIPNNNQPPHSDSSTSSTSSQQTWSFEEQFKQLYELSDDVKRKEFLDELFTFMQKRGSPINRLPIMAKSVLDLYELYNLVIARGGLVDVINKKLWQEIIKGLHLPSSITSAAFTLRTQYMKYLYPFECEKKRLSTPAELQAAIDGNRREGRRASYGPYPGSEMVSFHTQISPLSLVGGRPQINGNGTSHPLHSTSPNSPPNSTSTPNARDLAALELSRLTLWNLYSSGGLPPQGLPEPKTPPQQEALNLEVPSARSSEGAITPKVPSWHSINDEDHKMQPSPTFRKERSEKENGRRHDHHHNNNNNRNSDGPPPAKRLALDDSSPPPISMSMPRGDRPPMQIFGGNGTERVERERDRERHNNSTGSMNNEIIGMSERGMDCRNNNNSTNNGDRSSSHGATHIKINSRGDGRGVDNSMVVSMEINGIMYQGVLFAQNGGGGGTPATRVS